MNIKNIIKRLIIISILAVLFIFALKALWADSADNTPLENQLIEVQPSTSNGLNKENTPLIVETSEPSTSDTTADENSAETLQSTTSSKGVALDENSLIEVSKEEPVETAPSTDKNEKVVKEKKEPIKSTKEKSITQKTESNTANNKLPQNEEKKTPEPKIVVPNRIEQKSSEQAQEQNSSEMENELAKLASTLGPVLSGNVDTSSTIRGLIAGSVGNEFEKWLSQYAVAKVQLSIDKNLSLKNSQLDLLFPLHEEDNNLSFIQTSFHRTDERNQMNLGMGYRWFTDNWMLGGNTFFDYDLSRGHARIGFGLEYSRDFFRLSANSYFRVTNWKVSPDLTDYNERPANGWDIRAKAWLPQLPQLGGKLVYEQYYGNEVALFNKNTRSKDPTAITAGIEYSPFPLITFSVARTQASSNESDNVFSVEVNYELGVPWAQQIDPATLAKARSLIHNRYELVERNNNIILEYQKQVVITIKMVKSVTGYPGEMKPLLISVKSKYGYSVANINVTGSDGFTTQNGAITSTDGSYYVTIPEWNDAGDNIYTLSGYVLDNKDNKSNTAKTQVTVKEVTADADYSSFTVDKSIIEADGKEVATFTLNVKNSSNQFQDIDIEDIDVAIDYGTATDATVSSIVKKSTGTYTITLTAGKIIGNVKLTVKVQNVDIAAVTVRIVGVVDVSNSTISSSTRAILADGSSSATITVNLIDADGVYVDGDSSRLVVTATNSNANITKTITMRRKSGSTGIYEGSFTAGSGDNTDTEAGAYSIEATYGGNSIGSVTVTALTTSSGDETSFSAYSSAAIMASGNENRTFYLNFKDSDGNAIANAASYLSYTVSTNDGDASSVVTYQNYTETSSGYYEMKVRISKSGTYVITPTYNGSAITVSTGSLTASVTAYTVASSSSTLTPSSATISVGGSVALTLKLVDSDGNAITGYAGNLTTKLGTSGKNNQNTTFTETSSGTYTATATFSSITSKGTYTIVPAYRTLNFDRVASLALTLTVQ